MKKKLTVFAPASVGNATCGYDVLGFALESPGDIVDLTLRDQPGISIMVTGNDMIPTAADKNTCGVAAQQFLQQKASGKGVDIHLHKKMPIGSGLGSSAAGAAATIYGLNLLLGEPCDEMELLSFGLAAEKAACGAGHADNIAPSLFGGFILINSYSPLKIKKLPTPPGLYCTVVHPNIEIKTAEARDLLPTEIPMDKAVRQMGYLGGFVASLFTSDFEMMKNSLQDLLAEPQRAQLIPQFDQAMLIIKDENGVGGGISGSGPSLFALSKNQEIAENIGNRWKKIYNEVGCQVYISQVNDKGPRIIE